MPTEEATFTGNSVDDVIRQLQEAGATAKKYEVTLYDGETSVGVASGIDYNTALLLAAQQAGVVNSGVDVSKYRTGITVTGERPFTKKSKPAGPGHAPRHTDCYTGVF